jgi:plasmid stabilization system protein ParE
MQVIFHRLALSEYRRAISRYRVQDIDVARRFVTAVEDGVARIGQNPGVGSPCFGQYRWVRVKKFKYVLYYRQLSDSLVLLYAVAHAHRRPGYWLGRTRQP